MFHRRYGIFKSYRSKRRCTYNEMYKWYIEHCEDNDVKSAVDKFYSPNGLDLNIGRYFTVLIGRRWIIVIH